MSEIHIRIPSQQPELEAAITRFIAEEFDQQVAFSQEPMVDDVHKGSIIEIIWQGVTILATLDGAYQFSKRTQQLQRVQKLLEAIKKSGKSVYLKIDKDKMIDLSKKTASEIMQLLAKKEDKDKD